MTTYERDELEAEYFARLDYMREAFGPSSVHEDDDHDEDFMPGGVYPATAASALGRALYELACAARFKAAWNGDGSISGIDDYIPF